MTEEQEALLDKAASSIAAARVLLDQGFPEYSASRSYYAMFYAATALLDRHGQTFKRHSALLSAFAKLLHETEVVPKSCHRWISDAYNARIASDYRADREVPDAEASNHVENAERLMILVRQVLA